MTRQACYLSDTVPSDLAHSQIQRLLLARKHLHRGSVTVRQASFASPAMETHSLSSKATFIAFRLGFLTSLLQMHWGL